MIRGYERFFLPGLAALALLVGSYVSRNPASERRIRPSWSGCTTAFDEEAFAARDPGRAVLKVSCPDGDYRVFVPPGSSRPDVVVERSRRGGLLVYSARPGVEGIPFPPADEQLLTTIITTYRSAPSRAPSSRSLRK